MTPEEMEVYLKTVTDRLDALDQLIQGKKDMYFRCSHSGLLFPADYIKEWGRKYGIGLGPDPVSECLDSQYYVSPPDPRTCQTLEDYMHPFGNTKAQVDFVLLPAAAPHDMLVLSKDDPRYNIRKTILREKQRKNPKSKIYNLSPEELSKMLDDNR